MYVWLLLLKMYGEPASNKTAILLQHDCNPNAELLASDLNTITFRVTRKIEIGEEVTTF